MAVTSLTSGGGGNSSDTSFNTASVSPASNALILLAIHAEVEGGAAPNISGISGCGLTWVDATGIGGWRYRDNQNGVIVYRAMGSSPSSGAVTIDLDSPPDSVQWHIIQITSVSTSGSNGSGAVVQMVEDDGSSNSRSVTLAGFAQSINIPIGVMANSGGIATSSSPGSGFTTIVNHQQSSSITLYSEYGAANDNTVDGDVGGTGSNSLIVGIEISIVAAAANPTPGMQEPMMSDFATSLRY